MTDTRRGAVSASGSRAWSLVFLPLTVLAVVPAAIGHGASARETGAGQPVASSGPDPVYEFRNGLWFDGRGFVERTMYAQDGVFVREPSAAVDSVVDLQGRWVVPPYAEAHNHNVEAGTGFADRVRRYLSHGVFYVKNPNVLPSNVIPIRDEVNRPESIDVSFAYGGITGPGGHPVGVVRRNVARGIWDEDAGEGGFYYAVADSADLAVKWPALMGHRPDFVKTYLLYSEEFARRAADPDYVGQRGLDPDLLPAIVERAHGVGLRVTTHVETAADVRHALDAGVDEIAHLPGFRGNEENRFPDPEIFLLEASDARRAAERGTVVVTTLGNFAGSAPDSVAAAARRVFRHNLSLLHEHGVALAVGSDGYGSVGVSEAMQLHELEVFTNRELLKMWVETTPKTIFPQRKIGRLAPGHEASFLVLAGNPLEDFAATQDIALRVKRGVLLSSERPEREPK
jgi:hypothetical protein